MDVIEQGFYGACVDAHYKKVAKDICRRNGLPMPGESVPELEDDDETEVVNEADDNDEEAVDNFNNAVINLIASAVGYDVASEVFDTTKCKTSENVEDESDNLSAYTKGHWDENL